jgi:hypothetical protein
MQRAYWTGDRKGLFDEVRRVASEEIVNDRTQTRAVCKGAVACNKGYKWTIEQTLHMDGRQELRWRESLEFIAFPE